MRRAPIRIRAFILGTIVGLLCLPPLAAAAGWQIERSRQKAGIHQRLDTAAGYLASHGAELRKESTTQGFSALLNRLDLLAQVVVATTQPGGKSQVYLSPALSPAAQKEAFRRKLAGRPDQGAIALVGKTPAGGGNDQRRVIPIASSDPPATLVADFYYPPPARSSRALVALSTGIVVLLAWLTIAIWLAGRWMVTPLARLSAQVDKVAGGDLTITAPRSRIGEIANISQAVDGMTVALGDSAQRRAESDEARRFLITGIAHDLRTPLFALRGHLQAIGSRLGDPGVHLERAEARAEALERLIANLFAYTRDDYTQPTVKLEPVVVAELLREVIFGVEHAARVHGNRFELDGDNTLAVVVDRDRIRRALTNILDNAIRYSPANASVHLSWTARDESSVDLVVRDHGPGIDRDLLPHIFEPGIREASADGDGDRGAGLGLTIAKRLLEHQHADIAAHNDPSGGAVVTLTLARAPAR
jgi:signal transduction histidine kinase